MDFSEAGESMNKQPEITEQTRENIVEAYWKCAGRERPEKITVKEVAKVAGYNRSTFYQYFPDIIAAADYAETDLIEKLEAVIAKTIADGISPDILERSLKQFFDVYGRYLNIVLIKTNSTSFVRRLKDVLKPLVLAWAEIDYSDFDVALICEFVSSSMISALEYLFLHPEADRELVVHKLHAFLRNGAPGLLGER